MLTQESGLPKTAKPCKTMKAMAHLFPFTLPCTHAPTLPCLASGGGVTQRLVVPWWAPPSVPLLVYLLEETELCYMYVSLSSIWLRKKGPLAKMTGG